MDMTQGMSSLPLWLSALLIVIVPTVLAMLGPIAVRRNVDLERLATNNEVAGFKFATVGVIYAVMLAFAVIVVWEKFTDAENTVVQEAGAAATMYRLSGGLSSDGGKIRDALSSYLKLAVDKDFPAMDRGRSSPDATKALNAVYEAVLGAAQAAEANQALWSEILRELDSITQARRTRIHLSSGIVPGVIWIALFVGAILTVCFTFFFGTENLRAQVLMTGVIATIAFMGLFVIVAIDHPFTGPVKVDAEPLALVLETFGGAAPAD